MPRPDDIVPRGWPLSAPDEEGRLGYARGETALREAIWNIVATVPGERVMRPGFGGGLRQFVHRPNNETTRGLIGAAVREALTRLEPRVTVEKIEVRTREGAPSALDVVVRYAERASGERASVALAVDLSG